MKIESIEIKGLHGTKDIKVDFNNDLNIITGRNGAGKTTILKIIWYMLSANLLKLTSEYDFKSIYLKTNIENFEIIKTENNQLRFIGKSNQVPDEGKSLFFPTYRRIENEVNSDNYILSNYLEEQSKTLSFKKHKFISAVGTKDIELLYYKKNSENIDTLKDFTNTLEKMLEFYKKNLSETEEFNKIQIRESELRKELNTKDNVLNIFRNTVSKFINHSNIALNNSKNNELMVHNDDAISTIKSDLLSAGEKQMLSFIAYNTFYEDTIFIIDEPELSLHVDWQRQLVPTLLEQGTSNQFILATHSPFIYANYPDKEIQLLDDKGYNENFSKESISNKHEG